MDIYIYTHTHIYIYIYVYILQKVYCTKKELRNSSDYSKESY